MLYVDEWGDKIVKLIEYLKQQDYTKVCTHYSRNAPAAQPRNREALSARIIHKNDGQTHSWSNSILHSPDLCYSIFVRDNDAPHFLSPRRAAPMCAAADYAPHPQRRGTRATPYRHFTNSVGGDAYIVPPLPAALQNSVIANR